MAKRSGAAEAMELFHTIDRVVGITGMMEPKMDPKIVEYLIIKWDPEGRLECLVFESQVVFCAGSFYDSLKARVIIESAKVGFGALKR